LNNGSTDHTLRLLHEIEDDRLQVYSNDRNMGALYNMVNVLNKGRGEYLVYITDHDHIDYEKIEKFIFFLSANTSVSCGYCEFNSNTDKLFDIYIKGFPAVSKIAYITRHPTGYFFRNELLKSVQIVDRFSDIEYVDLFPLEFVFAELCELGDGAIYHDTIFSPETQEKIVIKHKSATTNGNSKNAFFSPQARLKLAINFENHINTLRLSKKDKVKLIINSFFRELYSATFGFRDIMNRKDICEHYYMESKKIRIKELLSICIYFYYEYSDKVIRYRYQNLLQRVNFKMLLVTNLLIKITRMKVHILFTNKH